MREEVFFQEVAKQFGLGEVICPTRRVQGGFLHKMYKLQTVKGTYALKLLNPVIMKRPDALGNFQRAENLERVLQKNDIPVIAALEKDGVKMQLLKGQYYYLFEWFEGNALDWHEIREEHCRIAGKLLAGIHRIPCGEERRASGVKSREVLAQRDAGGACQEERMCLGQENRKQRADEASGQENWKQGEDEASGQENWEQRADEASGQEGMFDEDWDSYIRQAAEACPEIAEELAESRELLYEAQREYNAAVGSVPKVRCICDGDMDCKNVLWKDGRPYIIDLECLDYGNPFTEMFQLALSWGGGAVCEMDFRRFGEFIRGYLEEYGGGLPDGESDFRIDWQVLSGIGYSWLDWLAYNVRRGLGIECGDEEERRLGICEARETIRRIRYYASVRDELVKYIEKTLIQVF